MKPTPTKKQRKFELQFFDILLELSKTETLYIGIPETFWSRPGSDEIILLSTNYETGELMIKHDLPRNAFVDSINFFDDLVKMKTKFPISVIKCEKAGGKDSCKTLYSKKDCLEAWNKFKSARKTLALQRYIPSSWNVTLFRCAYEGYQCPIRKYLIRKGNKNVYEHPVLKKSLININQAKNVNDFDDGSYLIKRTDQVSSSLVVSNAKLDLKMENLSGIIERYYGPGCKVINLQADWIQDPKGNFFLINVKSYQIRNELVSFVIDRPLRISQNKHNYSYSDFLIKRTLSPPFYFKCS